MEYNNIIMIENDKNFIPIYRTEKGIEVVNGRELYNNLPIGKNTKFTDWIKDNLESVDAIENKDFFQYKTKNPNGGRPRIEYILKVEIAKEICMITGVRPNASQELKIKSKAYRRYFISIEEKYKNNINGNNIELNDDMIRKLFFSDEENRKMILEKFIGLNNNNVLDEIKQLRKEIENLNKKINLVTEKEFYTEKNIKSPIKENTIINNFNYSRFLNHINSFSNDTKITKKEYIKLFNSYNFYHKIIGITILNKFMNENELIYGNDRITSYAKDNNILIRDNYKNHSKVFLTKEGILHITNLIINYMPKEYI